MYVALFSWLVRKLGGFVQRQERRCRSRAPRTCRRSIPSRQLRTLLITYHDCEVIIQIAFWSKTTTTTSFFTLAGRSHVTSRGRRGAGVRSEDLSPHRDLVVVQVPGYDRFGDQIVYHLLELGSEVRAGRINIGRQMLGWKRRIDRRVHTSSW